jgi:hypothetical protein
MKTSKRNIKWTEKKTDCKIPPRIAIEWEKVWTPYKIGDDYEKRRTRSAEDRS